MFVWMKIFRVHNNQSDVGGTRRGCNIHIGRPWARKDGWMDGCVDRWMLILHIRIIPYGHAEDAPIEPSPLCAPPPSRQGTRKRWNSGSMPAGASNCFLVSSSTDLFLRVWTFYTGVSSSCRSCSVDSRSFSINMSSLQLWPLLRSYFPAAIFTAGSPKQSATCLNPRVPAGHRNPGSRQVRWTTPQRSFTSSYNL